MEDQISKLDIPRKPRERLRNIHGEFVRFTNEVEYIDRTDAILVEMENQEHTKVDGDVDVYRVSCVTVIDQNEIEKTKKEIVNEVEEYLQDDTYKIQLNSIETEETSGSTTDVRNLILECGFTGVGVSSMQPHK